MKRLISALVLALALALPASAAADFGLNGLQASFPDPAGEEEIRAGAHPAANTTIFNLNTRIDPNTALEVVDGGLRDLHVALPAGFAGNATAMPACEMADFVQTVGRATECPDETVVGYLEARVSGGIGIVGTEIDPLYNLVPDRGAAAKLGAVVGGVAQLISVGLNPDPPHNLIASLPNISQIVEVRGSDTVVWGNPASPDNDTARGACATTDTDSNEDPFDDDACDSTLPEAAYLTMPRSCTGPLSTVFSAQAWWSGDPLDPDPVPAFFAAGAPSPAMAECASLGFGPEVSAAPGTDRASSPAGFDFGIEIDDPGLADPAERAGSDLKKAVVTLPEGFTANPAAAGGLEACSRSELARETPGSRFGAGCPAASRVASVDVDTPLLAEHLSGSVFLAEPYENPLGELLAGYLVLKQPERGVVVRLAGKIEADSRTGQLRASFDQNPQFPFSELRVRFFAGPRAPLSTADVCGDYEVRTELHPWSANAADVSTQPFGLTRGPGAGDCPDREAQMPHAPGFEAGAVSPIAGAGSPVVVALRRQDGEQRFSAVQMSPPPGLVARLAGVPYCPEAALAAAASREGEDERRSPSCPAASRVGGVAVAVGTGPDPYWAQGTAYLAPPYKGAPLSLAIVAPAVAGPFDLGVVVNRVALHVDPRSARITALSDPLPELLEGVPLGIREALVSLDRPGFARNGTSCEPLAFTGLLASTLGTPAALHSRFQLGECRRLAFKPRVALRLRGKTHRGAYQALRAVARPRPGEANISRTVVRFPRTAFVAQEHIRTVCTRVQFAARACPKGSVYGRATAYSPLLDQPLRGPVYLRSSDNPLPDAVAALRGPAHQPIEVELVGRTDSVKGALRSSFDVVPDAPVSYFRLDLFGGRKGLIVNSRNVCRAPNRARVDLRAHNGARRVLRPAVVNTKCKKKKRGKAKRRGQRRGGR